MSFLEQLLCLALIGILASLSLFGYQALITRTRLHADQQIIKTALGTARLEARADFPSTVHCDSNACTVHTQQGEKSFPLSGQHEIRTQLFPVSAGDTFTFTHQGLTAFHNGTILLQPRDQPKLERRVVVSAGGRISLK
jgi:Tfp pilus assembly protein FimT